MITLNYGKSLPVKKRNNGNIPVYSSAGLTGRHDKALVDSKGLIIGRKGTIGNVYKSETPFYAIDTSYYVLPNNDVYDFDFLFYLLKNNIEYLKSQSTETTFGELAGSTLKSLSFLFPSLPEQKAIASVLSSLDDKIDLLHRQNKTLEHIAETIFKKMFQQPSLNPSQREGLREAKEDWEVGVIPDEFDFLMGQSPKGTSFNEDEIGIPMYQGNADLGFRFPNRRIYTTEAKRLAQKYDTLVSVRAPVGEQNMAIEECCIGRGVTRFRYKSKPEFYTYSYFKLKYLMNEIKQFNNEGTVFGSISKGDFEKFEILIPPHSLVEEFQNKVKSIDDKVITNSIQIRTLEKWRDTLLPKLISGEVGVKL